jgi:isoleucyl-tRNA synthetase
MQNNKFVILNTEITDELYLEGLAREIVSKVQNLRKEKGFEIMDRITLYYNGDEDINKCFDTYKELIASETLATDVKKEAKGEEVDINSHKVTLDVEKN